MMMSLQGDGHVYTETQKEHVSTKEEIKVMQLQPKEYQYCREATGSWDVAKEDSATDFREGMALLTPSIQTPSFLNYKRINF